MNIYLLLLLLPPLIVVIVMKYLFHAALSWREVAVQSVVPLILVAAVWNVSRYSQMADTEILNGKVTSKEQEWVSCSHSYSCNCRTVTSGSGNNQTTSTVCDTCYEHSNDWDWRVYTTVGDFNIARVDRRGSEEPSRWSIVSPGQPVALEHTYMNYVQAAPESLFNLSRAKNYKGELPAYPRVYDYQYADRVIAMPGVKVPDLNRWNDILAHSLNDLGAQKQANIVVVMTKESPSFADALQAHWLGGKKNDVLVVIGTDYPAIKWARVYSWSKHDIINVSLRGDLQESKVLDAERTIGIITHNIATNYVRKPMADFEYLAEEAVPPMWVMILALILGTGASVGLGIYFRDNVCFEGRRSAHPYRRYR